MVATREYVYIYNVYITYIYIIIMIINILYTYIIVLYNLIYSFHVKQNMGIWQDYLPPTLWDVEYGNHMKSSANKKWSKKWRSILQKPKISWKNLDRLRGNVRKEKHCSITFLPTSQKKPSIKCISSEIRTFGSVLDVLVTLWCGD